MKNIPSTIYLQKGEEAGGFTDFKDLAEVSWCRDRIYETDIAYRREPKVEEESEAVRFAEWLDDNYHRNPETMNWCRWNPSEWEVQPDLPQYTTAELYQLFKQKNKEK